MSDKLTKKDLIAKINDLESELELWKSKTQLARNYSILKEENIRLSQKKKIVVDVVEEDY
tara:strand:- start:2263 stop:2442 length:180 start_codon:yes stop_codon:yes gene_type:complete